MNLIRRAWAIVKENRRAYLIINVAYYGLVAIFMVVAAFNQPVQEIPGENFRGRIYLGDFRFCRKDLRERAGIKRHGDHVCD